MLLIFFKYILGIDTSSAIALLLCVAAQYQFGSGDILVILVSKLYLLKSIYSKQSKKVIKGELNSWAWAMTFANIKIEQHKNLAFLKYSLIIFHDRSCQLKMDGTHADME